MLHHENNARYKKTDLICKTRKQLLAETAEALSYLESQPKKHEAIPDKVLPIRAEETLKRPFVILNPPVNGLGRLGHK